MRFEIRDLVWATAFAGLVLARFIDAAATREKELAIERLAHKTYVDVHDRLEDISKRFGDLDGWATHIRTRLDEDGREQSAQNAELSQLRTDVWRLQDAAKAKPAPATKGGR
jgi:hypothetical protein